MEEVSFKLEKFEGPLDLLLQLIEKNKVDIYDIPIAMITDQYLAVLDELREIDLDNLSEFLVMACTLLDIKARMLLPKEEDEEGNEIDPRLELELRLAEYQEYKSKVAELKEFDEKTDGQCVREEDLPKEVREYKPPTDYDTLLKNVTLEKLQQVFEFVLKRQEDRIDPVRAAFGTIKNDPVKIADKFAFVRTYGKRNKKFSFRNLLEGQKTKSDVVVTFLALLELIRIGQIKAEQEETFGEITLEWDDTVDVAVTSEDMKQYE